MKGLFKPALVLLLAIIFLSNNIACFSADQILAAATENKSGASVKSILSPDAYDIAEQLTILPLLEELYALQPQRGKDLLVAVTRLELRQKLTDKVLTVSLQVRDVTARIDKEIVRLDRMGGYLQDRRDKALKINTLSNAVGTGIIAEVGQAGEIRKNEVPGEITELVGIGISIALSALSFYLQKGQKMKVPAKPNMLSKVFKYQTDKDSEYPDIVWIYLNRVPPGSKDNETRLKSLFKRVSLSLLLGGGR